MNRLAARVKSLAFGFCCAVTSPTMAGEFYYSPCSLCVTDYHSHADCGDYVRRSPYSGPLLTLFRTALGTDIFADK